MNSTPAELTPAPVRVITPHSGLDAFGSALRSLVRDFSQARELAWRFFLRDTRAEHRQSILGYFWLVFPALANTLTWVFLNRQNVIHVDTGGAAYPLFVLSGSLLWGAFNGGVMVMLGIIGTARGVLARVNFPREAVVYAGVLRSSVDSMLAALLLIPALFLYSSGPRLSSMLFIVALGGSLLLGWALGLLLLPIAALYGDVSRLVQIALRYGFFLTPVIFQVPKAGFGRTVMLLNPATAVIVSGRAWLTGTTEALPITFMVIVVAGGLVFCLALVIYKVALPYIIERVGG